MYPNYVSSEAVLASENVFFSDYHAKQEAFELTMHPFCRNAVAAMDWGGTIMNKYLSKDNKSRHRRYTTDVFEMASAIMNQAAIQCIAIYPNNLSELPQHEIDFRRAFLLPGMRPNSSPVILENMPLLPVAMVINGMWLV